MPAGVGGGDGLGSATLLWMARDVARRPDGRQSAVAKGRGTKSIPISSQRAPASTAWPYLANALLRARRGWQSARLPLALPACRGPGTSRRPGSMICRAAIRRALRAPGRPAHIVAGAAFRRCVLLPVVIGSPGPASVAERPGGWPAGGASGAATGRIRRGGCPAAFGSCSAGVLPAQHTRRAVGAGARRWAAVRRRGLGIPGLRGPLNDLNAPTLIATHGRQRCGEKLQVPHVPRIR